MNTATTTKKSWTTAVTFAEAGEWDTARSFIPACRRNRVAAWFAGMFMAVTFAEQGMRDDAVRYVPRPGILPEGTDAGPIPPRFYAEAC